MSTTKAKTPTPQGISALLRRAGFDKSETRTSSIKGWHEWSAGFKCSRGWDEGTVRVEHRPSSLRLRDAGNDAEKARKRAAYTEVITEAGYAVDDSNDGVLIVTAPPGAEENRHG